MSEKRVALLELIEKIERLGQFQDRIDFPSNIKEIWSAFLADVRNLIEIEVCALFLVDENTGEFALKYAVPEDNAKLCRKEIDLQIECGIFSWVINRRQPALISGLAFDKKKIYCHAAFIHGEKNTGGSSDSNTDPGKPHYP